MKQNRTNDNKYIFLIFLAIYFFSNWWHLCQTQSLPPINTGFCCVLFSIPMLTPFLKKSELQALSRKQIATIILAGAFLARDLTLWNSSFSYTSVVNANLLVNLNPFTVIPVSYFLFKEKMMPKFLFGGLITLIGVLVLMANKASMSPDRLLGDSLSLGSSIFYAMFMITVYKLRDSITSTIIMFISAFGTLLVLATVIFFTKGFYVPQNFGELWPLLALSLLSNFRARLISLLFGKSECLPIILNYPISASCCRVYTLG